MQHIHVKNDDDMHLTDCVTAGRQKLVPAGYEDWFNLRAFWRQAIGDRHQKSVLMWLRSIADDYDDPDN